MAATWTAIGPEQIPTSITSTGRLSAIAVHPNDSNIIYVGGAQGGVWKTIDGGATWAPLTDQECSLAMGAIAIDPTNANIVYAGTGELHNSQDSYYGCGVLRSTDGGATWSQMGASVFDDNPGGGAAIARVVLKPGTPTTVFVASNRGLFRSIDSGTSWQEVLLRKSQRCGGRPHQWGGALRWRSQSQCGFGRRLQVDGRRRHVEPHDYRTRDGIAVPDQFGYRSLLASDVVRRRCGRERHHEPPRRV